MKTTQRTSYGLLACLIVSLLNSQCARPTADVPSLQSGCRIQQVVSTLKNATTEGTSQTQYTYDAAGNLLRTVLTNRYQSGPGSNQSSTTTETYSYDASNFLLRKESLTQESSVLGNQQTGFQRTLTTDYVYSDSRLASYRATGTTSFTTSGSTRQQTDITNSQYAYDATGQLVQQMLNNNQTTTYQNGLVTAYNYTPNGLNTYTVTDGLISSAFFPGTEGTTGKVSNLLQRRRYDDQRRPIEQRELINDTLRSYYTQAWQSGFTAEQSLPAFKGHPQIRSPYGEPGLVTDHRQFQVNRQQGNSIYESSRTTTVHELNAEGYVTRSVATTTNNASGQPASVLTTVYTYTNCN